MRFFQKKCRHCEELEKENQAIKDKLVGLEDLVRQARARNEHLRSEFSERLESFGDLSARKAALAEIETKAEKWQTECYLASQNVAELRDVLAMFRAQVARAVAALEDGNPGYAHKILTEHTKTFRRRRSRRKNQ